MDNVQHGREGEALCANDDCKRVRSTWRSPARHAAAGTASGAETEGFGKAMSAGEADRDAGQVDP